MKGKTINIEVQEGAPPSGVELEALVDSTLRDFEGWFAALPAMDGSGGNGPLTRAEYAILKTFLLWGLRKRENVG